LEGRLKVEKLLLAVVGEDSVLGGRAMAFLEAVAEVEGLQQVIKKLKKMGRSPEKWEAMCEGIVDEITKANVSVSIMDLLMMLSGTVGSSRFREKVALLLMAIVEEGDHVLREAAAERLGRLF
jgi:hypothetical protein